MKSIARKVLPSTIWTIYLHTPDLLVDLISSSRWSRMMSLINSYHAKMDVISLNFPSLTLTLSTKDWLHSSSYIAQILANWKLPENFMLYLKLEFWFEYSSFFCACGVKLMERKKRKIVAFKCSSNHIFVHKKYILRKKFVAELLGFE